MKRDTPIATLDFETDPFAYGRIIRPFAWGLQFDDDGRFVHGWHEAGPEGAAACVADLMAYLDTLDEPHTIYAHNGGRFDFLFLLASGATDVTVIAGRIVRLTIGRHVFHDSYAFLPNSLRELTKYDADGKLDIDMSRLEAGVRHMHRDEILRYLERDCVALLRKIKQFHGYFGRKLTVAGAAMGKLKEAVEVAHGRPWRQVLQRLTLADDKRFRPFFFGGRVECFEQGVIREDLKYHDTVSMYPDAMAHNQHPTGHGGTFRGQTAIDDRTDFAIIEATSHGALPWRDDRGRLRFPHGRGLFHATGHEIRAGLETGRLTIHRLDAAVYSTVRTDFKSFVNAYFSLRMQADADGDMDAKYRFKIVLNSSYGRFSLQPDDLYSWRCELDNGSNADRQALLDAGYEPAQTGPELGNGTRIIMWRRPAEDADKKLAIMNVCTGASITGAARAKLLRAIHAAERPLYCDTDSLICRSLDMPTGSALGDWKVEALGDKLAIAGKKLYAMFADGNMVKMASKGARLTAEQIVRVAEGEAITWHSPAPTFDIAGGFRYISRDIRMTAQPAWRG
jgi:hypothetical protein